jgi:hypothetical protein
MGSLKPSETTAFIFDSLRDAHERKPFVGGLFNAYEPAVHYELFNSALARGLNETSQERPIGKGQTSCDLVFPLADGEELWLEVKQWWFLSKAYASPYFMQTKCRGRPVGDWEKLGEKRYRAVLLLRAWDDVVGEQRADAWVAGISPLIVGAQEVASMILKEYAYAGSRPHTRFGDALLWSSCEID